MDKFVIRLLDGVDCPINGVWVGGISGEPAKGNHRCFRQMLKQKKLLLPNLKRYFIRLRLSHEVQDQWGLAELFPEGLWANGYHHDFAVELNKEASDRIENSFQYILQRNDMRVGLSYSRGNEQYISFGVELPVTAYDVLVHCPTNLTGYANSNLREIGDIFAELIGRAGIDLLSLYHNREALGRICRNAENLHRERQGIAKVGEGWVSQAELFNLIATRFPSAKREYSPSWLGSQRIDIYIPSHKVAIEYQGLQHYEPVEFFGGPDGFKETVARDQLKAELCHENNVILYEWPHTRPINEEQLEAFIKELMLATQ
ncbi:hypothetical protein OAW32_03555 [bacterium]|nr:hypothetical protein [bacterium]